MGRFATELLIGGETISGDGGELEVENPYNEEILTSVRAPSPEQLDAAIAAAAEAQRGWERTPALERAELLHEVATRLRARTD
jgi:lactaldehyde dehydrogenase / glycolaldehyde dehydrogenase